MSNQWSETMNNPINLPKETKDKIINQLNEVMIKLEKIMEQLKNDK